MIFKNIFCNILCSYSLEIRDGARFSKFISKVFVNGKFPKILPSENFLLYGSIHQCLPIVMKQELVSYAFYCIY